MRRKRGVRLGTVVVLVGTALLLSGFGPGPASRAASVTPGCTQSTTPAVAKSSGSYLGPGNYDVKLSVGSRLRCLILYVPPNPPEKDRPLVLVFHGALDTAQSTEQGTDFEAVAESTGEVVAFLQGYGDSWNDGAGTPPAEKAHVDDLAFTSSAIVKIERLVAFDHKRIIAAGFSNGALMVQLIGCRMANVVELIVPVEGQLPVNVSKGCAPSTPVSVYEIHGLEDPLVPYKGGSFIGYGGGAITVLSAPASVARWAKLDGCAQKAVVTTPTSGIEMRTYRGCHHDSLVRLRTIDAGGHSWGNNIGELVAEAIPPQ